MATPMRGRKVLLGVTGGIAAYKSADLCRMLVKEGAEVRVVMSEAACEFVTPLTMATLSNQPVHAQMFAPRDRGVEHVELAAWADLFVVAPATADFLARASQGRASDLISAVALAYAGPVLAAPAMNTNMWNNPATRRNLHVLETEHGWRFVQPRDGDLACGTQGPGRMAEPSEILAAARAALSGDLVGRVILVAAGPTVEDIDPVRFVSNRSSGRMGYAIAAAAARRGATVVLVSGPTALPAPPGVDLVPVRSALDMEREVAARAADTDAVVMAAAVADFRPAETAAHKLKKGAGEEERTLRLVRNPDILAGLGRRFAGAKRPVLVGFALETENLRESARAKLRDKGAAIVVANLAAHGLSGDDNEALIVDDAGAEAATGRISKAELADRILDRIAARWS